MEDRLQGAITTLQHSQEVIAQEEETGSDHKSEMCIRWDNVPLLSDVVTGVTITVPVTTQWNDTIRYHCTAQEAGKIINKTS